MAHNSTSSDDGVPSPPHPIFVRPIPEFARGVSPNPPEDLPQRVSLLETTVKEIRDWKRNDSDNGRHTANVAFERATDAQYTSNNNECLIKALSKRVTELEATILAMQTQLARIQTLPVRVPTSSNDGKPRH